MKKSKRHKGKPSWGDDALDKLMPLRPGGVYIVEDSPDGRKTEISRWTGSGKGKDRVVIVSDPDDL